MGTPGFQKCSSPTGCSTANGDVSFSIDNILLNLLFGSSAAVVFLYFAYFVYRLVLRVLRRYLAKAVISKISATEFKSSDGVFLDGAAAGVECVVCLSEIREGELVRVLPKCRHVFHVPCIDPWLKCHANCPVCRSNLADDVVNIDVDVQRGAPAVSPAPAGSGVSISTVPVHIIQPFEEGQHRVGLMENGVGTGMNSTTQAIDLPSIETSVSIEIDVR